MMDDVNQHPLQGDDDGASRQTDRGPGRAAVSGDGSLVSDLPAARSGLQGDGGRPRSRQDYPSKLGYPCKSDKAAKDCKAEDFDAVVIPGGFAPDFIRRTEAMIRLVSNMAEQGKVVAAICHGPWVLCSTQALKGKKATCFMAIKDDVINAGAKYVDQEVVRDGNIITSRKPDDLPAFLTTILQAVKESKPAMAGAR